MNSYSGKPELSFLIFIPEKSLSALIRSFSVIRVPFLPFNISVSFIYLAGEVLFILLTPYSLLLHFSNPEKSLSALIRSFSVIRVPFLLLIHHSAFFASAVAESFIIEEVIRVPFLSFLNYSYLFILISEFIILNCS